MEKFKEDSTGYTVTNEDGTGNTVTNEDGTGYIVTNEDGTGYTVTNEDGTGYTVTNEAGEIKLLLDELYHNNYCLLGCNTMYCSINLPTFQCKFIQGCMMSHTTIQSSSKSLL
jgi:hypothetical protein